jgi:hypothetical protein
MIRLAGLTIIFAANYKKRNGEIYHHFSTNYSGTIGDIYHHNAIIMPASLAIFDIKTPQALLPYGVSFLLFNELN